MKASQGGITGDQKEREVQEIEYNKKGALPVNVRTEE